jgi:hypothetical protein
MIRRALTSGFLLSLLVASPASAIVVAYDGFDYPNSSPLIHNRAGGFGWTEGWMDNDQDYNKALSIDDTSITSPTFPFTPIGDRVVVNGGEVIRSMGANFNMTQDGVTFYGSLLMKKGFDGGTSNDAVEFRLISNLTTTEAFRVGFGSDELLFIDSGATATSGVTPLVTGDPYFFVFKIVSSAAGNDQFFASAFGPSSTVPALEPLTWDVTHTEAVNHIFNGVRFQTGSAVVGAEYDELRIGNTWADVAVGGAFVLGDFNNSGGIDPGDLTNLINGLYVGNSYGQGDIDLNGVVDLRDYNLFRPIFINAGFGASLPDAVPEPAALALLVLAAFGFVARGRNRRV